MGRVAVQAQGVHSLQLVIFGQRERRSAVVLNRGVGVVKLGVSRGAGRHIFVDGRHLLIPADAEAAALGDVEVELHTEHAGGASRGNETGVAVRAEFLRHDQFDHQVVLDFQATGGLGVAYRVGCRVDAGLELHADLTASGIKVGLPAILLFIVADDAGLLVKNPLALAADLVGVLLAGGRDDLLVLFDAPHHLAQTPAGLGLVALVHHSAQGHVDGELADGVDDGGQNNAAGKVGGRENANGGLVVARDQSTAEAQRHLEAELLASGALGVGQQEIFHLTQCAIASGRQVTGEQVTEGEVMLARLEVEVLGEEVPTGEFIGASRTAGAVGRDGLLGAGLGNEADIKLAQGDLSYLLGEDNAQAAGEQSPRGIGGRAVADEGR